MSKFNNFSTYILIIALAFIISFIIFYWLSRNNILKLDILCLYFMNIFGFFVGSKLSSLFLNKREFNLINLINSGYSYIGGILGSILFVFLYCKRYKMNFKSILSYFSIIYPLIYSISKVGCFLNKCCNGNININILNLTLSLQLIDVFLMLMLFIILLLLFKNRKILIISDFLIWFNMIRFLEDYYRDYRNIFIYNVSLKQIICFSLIIIGIILKYNKKFLYN